MRIVRYPLPITDYQQIQPLWPGRILSVAARRYDPPGNELPIEEYGIDIWALDNDAKREGRPAPLLGVWMIGTGNPIPSTLIDNDALFHATVDFRPALEAIHVWTAVVGYAETTPAPLGQVSSVDDIAEKMRQRHAGRTQR